MMLPRSLECIWAGRVIDANRDIGAGHADLAFESGQAADDHRGKLRLLEEQQVAFLQILYALVMIDYGAQQYLNLEQRVADRCGQFVAPLLIRFLAAIGLYAVAQQIAQRLE